MLDNHITRTQLVRLFLLNLPTLFAFILCFIYWIYLLFSSQMIIVYDALAFEDLGKMLYQSGWIEFFKTGPHNEPVFPLLIALTMRVADLFAISYQTVQTCLQMFILFSAQLLTLFILKQIKISQTVTALTILYMGISPALVNATFSLWSEIAAYPFVLAIVLISVKSWRFILKNEYQKIILWASYLAFFFIIITSIKALFEYIFVVFMAPFLVLLIRSLVKREKKSFIGAFLFLLITVFFFNVYLFSYKSLNQKYNGHFMLTDRGPYILYGNIAKRDEPLTLKRFFSGLAFVAGDRACYKFFDQSDCDFWHIFTVEKYGREKLNELENSGVPNSEIDARLMGLAKNKILENPFQQILLMGMESFKMLFWESTLVGFVFYPAWLQSLFEFTPFKNGLRLLLFLATSISILMALRFTLKRREKLFHYPDEKNISLYILFFILIFVISYTAAYSFFIINTRYASPIASLYLIMIAFTIENIRKTKTE